MHEVEVKFSALQESTELGDIEARLTRNLCECMAKYVTFRRIVPES